VRCLLCVFASVDSDFALVRFEGERRCVIDQLKLRVSERGIMLEYEHPTTLVGVGTEVLCYSFFILSLSLYYYYILYITF